MEQSIFLNFHSIERAPLKSYIIFIHQCHNIKRKKELKNVIFSNNHISKILFSLPSQCLSFQGLPFHCIPFQCYPLWALCRSMQSTLFTSTSIVSCTRSQFHQHFHRQSWAAFAHIIFNALMATAFGKNVPKYGARCKNCSLKYSVKFQ